MTTTTAAKHTRRIEHSGEGEDREYSASCSCRTVYVSRLSSYADAVEADRAHKAAVADGTWQAERDAEAARLADLAPLHEAQREAFDAKEARTSAAFGVIVARQRNEDVDAARAILAEADERLAAADAALAAIVGA